MARLQVLHLPAPAGEYPFALVLDDLTSEQFEQIAPRLVGSGSEAGARCVLAFPFPVEVV